MWEIIWYTHGLFEKKKKKITFYPYNYVLSGMSLNDVSTFTCESSYVPSVFLTVYYMDNN